MEDLKIMQKCLDWDLNYFWNIYDKYIDKIHNFVYIKTTNKEVTEDIVSDVFLSALKNINSFKIEDWSSVQAWLYKIAYNKVIDFYRTNKDFEDVWDCLEMSCSSDFSQDIDNKDKLKEVFKYLETIKKEHRDILVYRIWDDLSYKEISDITWLSVDNCKKIVSRTLKTISANFVLLILILLIL